MISDSELEKRWELEDQARLELFTRFDELVKDAPFETVYQNILRILERYSPDPAWDRIRNFDYGVGLQAVEEWESDCITVENLQKIDKATSLSFELKDTGDVGYALKFFPVDDEGIEQYPEIDWPLIVLHAITQIQRATVETKDKLDPGEYEPLAFTFADGLLVLAYTSLVLAKFFSTRSKLLRQCQDHKRVQLVYFSTDVVKIGEIVQGEFVFNEKILSDEIEH